MSNVQAELPWNEHWVWFVARYWADDGWDFCFVLARRQPGFMKVDKRAPYEWWY